MTDPGRENGSLQRNKEKTGGPAVPEPVRRTVFLPADRRGGKRVMLERHLFIIGMPGSGKSSLGKRTAKETGMPFVDTDGLITQAAGCTVAEIFEKYGEAAFRSAETNTLSILTRVKPSIISTGGGTVMNETNRKIMKNWGLIVLIDRPLEDIMSDIKLDRRPNLQAKGLGELERLYEERMPVYRSVADVVLDNSQGYHAAVGSLMRIVSGIY